jgi:hypothetical protein
MSEYTYNYEYKFNCPFFLYIMCSKNILVIIRKINKNAVHHITSFSVFLFHFYKLNY